MAVACALFTLVVRVRQPALTDFTHFYTLGRIAVLKQASLLYDPVRQDAMLRQLVPSASSGWYLPVYAPQTALVFAPISALPYPVALVVWAVVCLASYGYLVASAVRSSPVLRLDPVTIVLLAAAFPPLWYLLAYLQSTAIPLLAFGLGAAAFRRQRPFLAGLAFGLLAVKPQLGVVLGCVAIAARGWSLVAGALVSVGLQLGAALAWFGSSAITDYARVLVRLPRLSPLLDPKPEQLHSLLGFFQLLMPRGLAVVLWAVSSALVVGICVRVWRSSQPVNARLAAMLLGTVLVSPHVMTYDMLLLAPALIWLGDWVRQIGRASTLRFVNVSTYALYPAFLLPAGVIRVQLSTLIVTALLVVVLRLTSGDGIEMQSSAAVPGED